MTTGPDPGADVQARQRSAERTRALRGLLMRPLMQASDPDFARVRRHADALREWLARETGWVLHVERDCARLYKRPADLLDATRGLPVFRPNLSKDDESANPLCASQDEDDLQNPRGPKAGYRQQTE